jgi:hypothetical protein
MTKITNSAKPIKVDKTTEAIITAVCTFIFFAALVFIDRGQHGFAVSAITLWGNPLYYFLSFWMNPISTIYLLSLSALFLIIIHVALWKTMKGFFWKGYLTGHTWAYFILVFWFWTTKL